MDKVYGHNVSPGEAEYVVRHAKPPYPKRHRKDTWIVRGLVPDGYYTQVIYMVDPDDTLFVIHAMPIRR